MGMHRSGTSLVARVLAGAGAHMGADCNEHEESGFFRELNKQLFRAGHADWDWPRAMEPALEDEALCDALVDWLQERLTSKEARAFLGRRFGPADLLRQPGPWGWKDPRNTCTLPLWLRVFPAARVVNVYRHGVDVAASLVARERGRRGRIHNEVRSSRCLDPQRAFELWTEYLEMTLRVTADLPASRVRDVRYESLLEEPEEQIRQLLAFAGLGPGEAALGSLAAEVRPEQGRAFRDDPEWAALQREKAGHPLMQRLEYGDPP
jgi:hypothetical protein